MIPVSQPDLSSVERKMLMDAFDSGWISSSGDYLARFEAEYAMKCNSSYCLGVSNGTVALHLALLALNVGPGDEVIVPSMTYIATANAVRYVGATPVFADISCSDWGLDLSSVESLFSPRTRAVIVVHLYGHPANLQPLKALCDAEGVWLIEDAAEAPFATRDDWTVGEVGEISTFSFYGNKVITSGEGGAVVTSNEDLYARMKVLRGQGMDPSRRYWFSEVGYNYRMTNLSASILCGQLNRLADLLEARRSVYRWYTDHLRHIPGVELQPRAANVNATPWLYTILLPCESARESVAESLRSAGVDTRPTFVPIHSLPPYLKCSTACDMSVTDDIGQRGLSLPTFPALQHGQVEYICNSIESALLSWRTEGLVSVEA